MTTYLIAGLGAAIGVASGVFGAGPSIFTVLLLTNVAGLALHRAVATSLVVVAVMRLVALVPYALERAVVWRSALAFGITSTTGAYLAGHVAGSIPEHVLQVIFLMATVVAAVAMLGERPPLPEGGARPPWQSMVVLATGGLLVGSLTGLIGLGGGFAVVPLLVVFAGTSVHAAVGTSILVIAMNTLAGLAGHLPHPPVDWGIAGYLAVTEGAGSLAGARLSKRIDAAVRRRAFAALMLAAALSAFARAMH